MKLNEEQQALLDGSRGEVMAKIMKTLVMYGDAFDAGLLYGLSRFDTHAEALEFAAAAAVLKHSVPGDINLCTAGEIRRLAFGSGDGRIKR